MPDGEISRMYYSNRMGNSNKTEIRVAQWRERKKKKIPEGLKVKNKSRMLGLPQRW